MKRLTRLMDTAVGIPGTRFRVGLDGLVGLIPGLGDAVGLGTSIYIILLAHRLGVPRHRLAAMGFNVVLDAVGGTLPIVGDVFDMAFKANRRNLELLGLDPDAMDELDLPDQSGPSPRRKVKNRAAGNGGRSREGFAGG